MYTNKPPKIVIHGCLLHICYTWHCVISSHRPFLTGSCFLAASLTRVLCVLCLGGHRNLSMFPISTGGSPRKGPRSNRKHERPGRAGSARSWAQRQHNCSGSTGPLYHRMQCCHPSLCNAPAGRQHTAHSTQQSATPHRWSQPGRRRVHAEVSDAIVIKDRYKYRLNKRKHALTFIGNPYLWSLKVSLNLFTSPALSCGPGMPDLLFKILYYPVPRDLVCCPTFEAPL